MLSYEDGDFGPSSRRTPILRIVKLRFFSPSLSSEKRELETRIIVRTGLDPTGTGRCC